MGAACCGERFNNDQEDEPLLKFTASSYKITPEQTAQLNKLVEAVDKDMKTFKKALDKAAAEGVVSMQENTGFTTLMYASLTADVKKIQLLLEAGADVSLAESRGMGALHIVAKSHAKDAAEAARLLLEAGADKHVNATENDAGKTALHFAAETNNLLLVDVLLDAGASPSIASSGGKLPADLTSNDEIRETLGVRRKRTIFSNKASTN